MSQRRRRRWLSVAADVTDGAEAAPIPRIVAVADDDVDDKVLPCSAASALLSAEPPPTVQTVAWAHIGALDMHAGTFEVCATYGPGARAARGRNHVGRAC